MSNDHREDGKGSSCTVARQSLTAFPDKLASQIKKAARYTLVFRKQAPKELGWALVVWIAETGFLFMQLIFRTERFIPWYTDYFIHKQYKD